MNFNFLPTLLLCLVFGTHVQAAVLAKRGEVLKIPYSRQIYLHDSLVDETPCERREIDMACGY